VNAPLYGDPAFKTQRHSPALCRWRAVALLESPEAAVTLYYRPVDRPLALGQATTERTALDQTALDAAALDRSTVDGIALERTAPDTAKVTLLTGASSGIGAALAAQLAARRGYRLLLSGRDRERLRSVARGTGGTALPADLSTDGSSERLAQSALSAVGRVDVLIAAAGIGWCGRFEDMPLRAVDSVIAVDLTAVIHLVRLLLPHMIARGSGTVALIGSVAGGAAVREEAVYSAAKAGLATFADSLRQELRGSGVHVIHVVPGVVDTLFFERRGAPYRRNHPRPVPASRVADATIRAIESGRAEVYVPRWTQIPGIVRGMAPGTYRRLSARFG
jgi:uncharacterized protein